MGEKDALFTLHLHPTSNQPTDPNHHPTLTLNTRRRDFLGVFLENAQKIKQVDHITYTIRLFPSPSTFPGIYIEFTYIPNYIYSQFTYIEFTYTELEYSYVLGFSYGTLCEAQEPHPV